MEEELPFLVDTGATFSTINVQPPQDKLSSATVDVVGFSGLGQKLPLTKPLPTRLGRQALLHPYLVSVNVPVNLLGRDLLIKLGATILCSPDGLIVTLPDGTNLNCDQNVAEAGQWLVQPLQPEVADIYWGLLNPETPEHEGLMSVYLRWKPWISLLEPYAPPPTLPM